MENEDKKTRHKQQLQQYKIDADEKSRHHMGDIVVRMINRRGQLPESMIERLSMTKDERLYDKLLSANNEGNIKEAIKSEPSLQDLADKL